MPDKMYVVRLENDFKDITRTLLRCRLLNKMKGMKPTRERYIRRHSQTGTRKSLTGPTPEKDNAAIPGPLSYICGPSSRIRTSGELPRYRWKPSSGLELTSCGAERCSRVLETTGRPTKRRSSVGGSSQGRIRAGRWFVHGACQGYASQSFEEPSTVLAECSLGRRAFQGYAYGRLLRRLQRSGWCLRADTVVELSAYRVGRSFVSLWSFWTALLTIQAMELGGCPTLSEDVGCDGERIRSVILLVM